VACRALDVSVSGYFDWLSRPPSARAIRHVWLTDLIVEVHRRARGAYGEIFHNRQRRHSSLCMLIPIGFESVAIEA
jgi:hypothetical protein